MQALDMLCLGKDVIFRDMDQLKIFRLAADQFSIVGFETVRRNGFQGHRASRRERRVRAVESKIDFLELSHLVSWGLKNAHAVSKDVEDIGNIIFV